MSKVIVERPRYGSHWKTRRRHGRLDPTHIVLDEDLDDDRFTPAIGHRRALRHTKSLNENLAPLRRYLLSQVGRPWNAVWSDICENLRPTNTVQQHVRDHITDFVAIKTSLRDGEIWVASRHYAPRRLSDAGWRPPLLYVDPLSGVLHLNPHRPTHRSRADAAARLKAERSAWVRDVEGRPNLRHVLLDDGNWWEVRLTRYSWAIEADHGRNTVVDVVDSSGLCTRTRDERYGITDRCAVEKRPLSRRELETFGLRRR